MKKLMLFVAHFLFAVSAVDLNFREQRFDQVSDNAPCVPYSSHPKPPLRCGGTFETQKGTIFYKPYEYIEDNERCIWTINTISAYSSGSSISFNVLYLGFPLSNNRNDSSPRLDFTGINLAYNNIKDHMANGTGTFDVREITSAVVIFSTGGGNMGKNFTGFILVYETFNSGTSISSLSFIQTPPANFNYLRENVNSETLFLIPPPNNFFPGSPFPIIYLENLRQSVHSKMKVYKFNRSSDKALWVQVDEIYTGNGAVIMSGQQDILLITSWISNGYSFTRDFVIAHVQCRKPRSELLRYIENDDFAKVPQTHI